MSALRANEPEVRLRQDGGNYGEVPEWPKGTVC